MEEIRILPENVRAKCAEHPIVTLQFETAEDGSTTAYCYECCKWYPICGVRSEEKNVACVLHANHGSEEHAHGALRWRFVSNEPSTDELQSSSGDPSPTSPK